MDSRFSSLAAAAALTCALVPAHAANAQAAATTTNLGDRWVCRTADASNAQNATATIGGAPLSLACRSINVTLTTADGRTVVVGNPKGGDSTRMSIKSPQYSGSMTASGLNDQWVTMMRTALGIGPGAASGTMNAGPRWVCRAADAANPQNGSLNGASTALSCRAVNFSMKTSGGQTIVVGTPPAATSSTTTASTAQTISVAAPDYGGSLSPSQLNTAWVNNTYRLFGNPSAGGP